MSKTNKSSKSQNLVSNILHTLRPNSKASSKSSKASTSPTNTPTMATTSLAGKVAIVTGSSRSIGAAIAKALGAAGANVVVNYVSNGAGAANEVVSAIKTAGPGDAIAAQADAGTVAGGKSLVDAAVAKWGRLDIIVLNAGIMGSKVIADVDEEFFDSHMQTNVKAPLFTVKHALQHLKEGGRIIFFSSSLTYATGPVDTPLFRTGKPQQVIDFISKQNPNGRLGLPEDIAPTVAFVASPAAQWLNGQNIRVNGGFTV
ncbi:hypothetical protein NP233_g898 [Leucocoprinus birnbaumii]|uniref:Uncharacterized protein n=1 Tax=Leucocoprinus birnbaumii TaxID=56174 RepID=A0AAD5W360_9AGAR|nr:hypothetical protein NP233_g898 [Leucocoprinus birnbaumii]